MYDADADKYVCYRLSDQQQRYNVITALQAKLEGWNRIASTPRATEALTVADAHRAGYQAVEVLAQLLAWTLRSCKPALRKPVDWRKAL